MVQLDGAARGTFKSKPAWQLMAIANVKRQASANVDIGKAAPGGLRAICSFEAVTSNNTPN